MHVIKYLLEHKAALAAVFVLLLAQAFCDLSLPSYTASIVDNVVQMAALGGGGDSVQELISLGVRMLLFACGGLACSVLIGVIACKTAATIGRNLRHRLFSQVVAFSAKEIDGFSAASLITRGTNDIQQIQFVSMMLQRVIFYAPILAVGGVIMVVRTNVSLGWVIALAIVALVVVLAALMMVTMPKFKIMQQLVDKLNLVSREILTGLPVIRAFGREEHEQGRFAEASADLMKTQLFTTRTMVMMMPVMNLVMNLLSVGIVWVGGHHIQQGTMQTGDLIAFITYATIIIMSFLMIGAVAIFLPRADVAAQRVNEVISTELSITDPATPRDEELDENVPAVEIRFENVSFRYEGSDENALSDVSFTAKAGEITGIIGPTGCGKTTIVKLIERFYDASEGRVLINGIDVRELSQSKLRSLIGYSPQQAFLFAGTVASNVGYAKPGMDEKRINDAAAVAQASEFIASKEEGLAASISQGGTNVSGGQRQRLSIARALAAEAKAYLFDDSFSALDYKTDAQLRASLAEQMKGKTMVIVAQRIATIMHADQIVVIDEGRIVGKGTHRELIESCEQYAQIAMSQLSHEELMRGGAA